MISRSLRAQARDFKGTKMRPCYRGAFFDISVGFAEKPTVACVISKKRIKRAVDRNRAKRKIYALIPEISAQLKPSFIVIYPTKQILQTRHSELKEEITKAFATL